MKVSTFFLSLESFANLLKASEILFADSLKERFDDSVRALFKSTSLSASLKLTPDLKMARALAS